MKCTLEYKGGEWMCSCPALVACISAFKQPDESIRSAITAFHSRYYPDEKPSAKHYPWVRHAQGITPDIKREIQEHELTWHWRLLLLCLRDAPPHTTPQKPVVLCVSQIRQWQLVSCFAMNWPRCRAETMPHALRTAPKSLLRAPVFGKSHRITRWEVYAAFHDPRIRERIVNAVKNAKGDPYRLAHVLGRHDSYFRIMHARKTAAERYELEMEHVIDLEPEQWPIRLCGQTAPSVCRPYSLASIPTFRESRVSQHPEPRELLFSSDNYCRAFEQLSDVINDPGAKAVLVIAPPGSGKEELCSVLHACRRHDSGKLVVTNLAGHSADAAAAQLFKLDIHANRRQFQATGRGWQLGDSFTPGIDSGALFRALGGTLVIDEFDKIDVSVRPILLRLLENDEAPVPGTSLALKIPPSLRPLYVFAGSATRKEFLQLPPVDLWTRMTHIIEMQHPLALGEAADRQRAAEDYVRLFWLKAVNDFFENERLLDDSTGLYGPLRQRFADWWTVFCSRDMGDFIARELARLLCAPGQALPSVRAVKGTVGRCFNLMFNSLLFHKNGDAPLEVWRRAGRRINPHLDPPKELVALIKRSQIGGRRKFSQQEVEALNDLRTLIRASATIQV
jgi:hypothetical protein